MASVSQLSVLFMSMRMSGDELKLAAIELFGERGWQSALSARLGIDRTQVWRYVNNNRVPGPVSAAVQCWLERKREIS